MRVRLCKHVLTDAIRHMEAEKDCIGFGFGGDANASLSVWTSAMVQTPQLRLTFQDPVFMIGQHQKNGDLMIGAACTTSALQFFENSCEVPNRELQHDCLNLTWCYQAQAKA